MKASIPTVFTQSGGLICKDETEEYGYWARHDLLQTTCITDVLRQDAAMCSPTPIHLATMAHGTIDVSSV
jgi:hypothetical protein